MVHYTVFILIHTVHTDIYIYITKIPSGVIFFFGIAHCWEGLHTKYRENQGENRSKPGAADLKIEAVRARPDRWAAASLSYPAKRSSICSPVLPPQ
jgi:hypothetical protein